MADTRPPTTVSPSTIHPSCLTALNRVLNKEIAFAIYVHSPTCESITVDYEAKSHEDCTSLYKHPRLLSGGAKFVVVDVSRARVRKGGEEVVEIDLGGKGKADAEGVVFIQWRFEGGSVEVCEVFLPYSRVLEYWKFQWDWC